MSALSRFGFFLAVMVFAADRLSKWWLVDIFDLPARGAIDILPFFEITMVWNRGVSMGLFQAGSDGGRYFIIALTGAVAIGLSVWLWRVRERLLAIALGLIVGGAVGNIWDRIEYGAVADFFRFHTADWSFFVFNVADSAISLGVALLLLDALLSSQKDPKRADDE